MITFIKNHKKILFLIFAVIFFSLFMVFVFRGSVSLGPQPTPQTDPWSTFEPGVTTKEQVISKLGNPLSETTQNGQVVSDFKSISPTRNNEVTFSGNTSSFFKHIIAYGETLLIKDLTSKYGLTNIVLYGPDATAGFYLYVYPDKGIAYLGNPNSGDLLEVWYFAPTTLENFQNQWAKNYSKTFPQAQ